MTQPKSVDVDVLVVGAGVIGSSVAMHLVERNPKLQVRVVDPDMEGTFSSSELNAGGVRATWIQPLNIVAGMQSIDYFAKHAEEVGYRACGYLWMHTPENWSRALEVRERQVQAGWPVEAWDARELQRRVPFLDKLEGVAGAMFSPRDGLINPNRLKNHYREKAKKAGAVFDDRTWVRAVSRELEGMEVSSTRVQAEHFVESVHGDSKLALFSSGKLDRRGEPREYRARYVVNCAGAWAPKVAGILGYACPSQAIRRQVCVFDCRGVDLTPYGMIVDTSGVYFHPEATNGLAGFATPGEAPGYRFDYDGPSFFEEVIWPALYERSTQFERLKHLTGWAGLYEVSPDESAIIGAVPGAPGLFEAHSFSGHGVMHSYVAGRALAELILGGKYETIDFSPLSGGRFAAGKEIRETWII